MIFIVDYVGFLISKTIVELITDLAAGVCAMKMIAMEGFVLVVVDIAMDDIDIEMVLIRQYTTVLLQVAVLGSKI